MSILTGKGRVRWCVAPNLEIEVAQQDIEMMMGVSTYMCAVNSFAVHELFERQLSFGLVLVVECTSATLCLAREKHPRLIRHAWLVHLVNEVTEPINKSANSDYYQSGNCYEMLDAQHSTSGPLHGIRKLSPAVNVLPSRQDLGIFFEAISSVSCRLSQQASCRISPTPSRLQALSRGWMKRMSICVAADNNNRGSHPSSHLKGIQSVIYSISIREADSLHWCVIEMSRYIQWKTFNFPSPLHPMSMQRQTQFVSFKC